MPAIVKHIKSFSPFKDDYESEDEVFVDENEDVEAQIVPAPQGLQDAADRARSLGGLLTPPPGFAEEEELVEDTDDVPGADAEGEGTGLDAEGGGTDTATAAGDADATTTTTTTAAADAGAGEAGAGSGEDKVPQPPKGRPPSGNPRRPASGARKGR
eukprot:TRINITY_DN2756_c0_g4_i2.p1 TRINITY_DN2756_c0_g4~~TRINITY_DN2756_c0_g4_i2.p1  ORF type:complete len:157 (+),score=53.22 TRINITY_DN2756_c0_g4_i2:291-761(+)